MTRTAHVTEVVAATVVAALSLTATETAGGPGTEPTAGVFQQQTGNAWPGARG